MCDEKKDLIAQLKAQGLTDGQIESRLRELDSQGDHGDGTTIPLHLRSVYDGGDLEILAGLVPPQHPPVADLHTIDDLLERDRQREEDGFPRRIRIGKVIKPSRDKKDKIVVVPTTTEPKFLHDTSVIDEEEQTTGGSGDGDDGEVIGEQPEQEGQEGEGAGAGHGEGAEHDVSSDAFDLGRVLTEKFSLPNLKVKGKKRSFTKFTYDLTDRNRESGQVLDKKETLKQVVRTNILLGNISGSEPVATDELVLSPKDQVFRVLSREKDFETQAVVFFVRDYSGSMQGKPTEVVGTQHLFIYSWLMFQYKSNVETRFILHDNEAKEVPDFYTYHNSQVAGGTSVYPAYELVNTIVFDEQLMRDNNIYVFHGTDGDDWDSDGEKAIAEIKRMLTYTNRFGISIARNSWSTASNTTVEQYMEESGLLKERAQLVRLDSMLADEATEARLIEGIRRLIE